MNGVLRAAWLITTLAVAGPWSICRTAPALAAGTTSKGEEK